MKLYGSKRDQNMFFKLPDGDTIWQYTEDAGENWYRCQRTEEELKGWGLIELPPDTLDLKAYTASYQDDNETIHVVVIAKNPDEALTQCQQMYEDCQVWSIIPVKMQPGVTLIGVFPR